MKSTNTLLAMAILASATSAAAGSKFETLDVDNSGSISKEEASKDALIMTKFDELDIDSNGELSKEEFANAE